MNKKKNYLAISDLHFPYQHRDTFPFLYAIAEKYAITHVFSVGDVNDNHIPSYHESEPDAFSGEEEVERAALCCQKLEEMFPVMKISLGNHDLIPQRKAKTAGVPLSWVNNPNNVYGLKGGWDWQSHHKLKVAKDVDLLVTHSIGTNLKTNAMKYSHCSVQGHHHGTFGVEYYADMNSIRWCMGVGCLVDIHSAAQRYGNGATLNRQILGAGVIINGQPIPIPMTFTKSGRKWTGRV